MKTLNKYDIQKLEEFWAEHNQNKRLLRIREWELTAKTNTDENTGGGKGNSISNPTEIAAAKLLNDKTYQNLKSIIGSIEHLYKNADKDIKTIVDMRYWDEERNCYEWEDIADQLNMSRSKVLRLRNVLLDDTADMIGWV